MTLYKLKEMVGGWFVGNFDPVVVRLLECEVACKHYRAGDKESKHVHQIALEVTVVASGRIRMNEREFVQGDIVKLEPGEPAEFEALEDSITLVVKVPSVKGDKYVLPSDP